MTDDARARVRRIVSKHPRRTAAVAVLVLLLGGVLWAAISAWQARGDVDNARDQLEEAKSAIVGGDAEGARAAVDAASADVESARRRVESGPLSWIGSVPGLGRPIVSVQSMIGVVGDLLTEVLQPVANSPAPTILADAGSSKRIDLAAVSGSLPALAQASGAAADIASEARDVPSAGYVSVVDDARAELISQTASLAEQLANADKVAPILPSMLGADGPRTYLMVFQTNAESRGTGGLMGGTALLRFENGAMKIEDSASNLDVPLQVDPLDLGPEFQEMYGRWNSSASWQNANFSPHFPYAAQIWRSIWQQYAGVTVDGVIATDPVALSYLLDAAGPVTLSDGEVIDSSNVVPITQNEAYFRYPAEAEQGQRKQYLQEISTAVIAAINNPSGQMKGIVEGLGKAVGEGRLDVWSADPADQAVLETLPVGHVVPTDPVPYANVVVNNGAGGKLDYYLQRSLTYTAGPCENGVRKTTVTAVLTNTAPARDDYPSYIAGRRTPETQYPGPPGTNRSIVSFFATAGAQLDRAELDDSLMPFVLSSTERGHPVFTVPVILEPGQTKTLTWELTEPALAGVVEVPVQPLVLPANVTVDVSPCG